MLRTLIQKKENLRSQMVSLWQEKEKGKDWSKEQSEKYDKLNEQSKKLDSEIKLRSEFVESFNADLPKPEKEFKTLEGKCSVFNLIKRELSRDRSDIKIDSGPIDEILQERANKFPEVRSLGGMPFNIADGLKKRATISTASSSGADLVEDTIFPDIIPNLYAKSWTGRAGCDFVENWRGDFLLPKEDTEPTSGFIAETANYPESSIDYAAAVSLKPLKVGALQPFSLQSFMQDETRKLQNSINSQLLTEWAKKVDSDFLNADGNPATEPKGILNISGIEEVDASVTNNVSEPLTYAKLLDCEGELLEDNQDMPPLWLINSKTLIHARKTLRNNVAGSLYLANKSSLADRRFVMTNLVPSDKKKGTESTSTSSWAILFIPSSVVVVSWAMPTIAIDRSLGFKSDTIWTKVSGYLNIGLKRPSDVVVLKNIKTS